MQASFTQRYATILAKKQHGWICLYCGKLLIPGSPPHGRIGVEDYAEVDHMTPKSRGGTDDISNLALVCKSCNAVKRNKTAAEFLEWRKDWLLRRDIQKEREYRDRRKPQIEWEESRQREQGK